MSVVIVGGHDRMVCQYKDICKSCKCKAKVFTQPEVNLECMMGNPDLIVLFTNPVSHQMAKIARNKAAKSGAELVQSHSASCAA
ncbi:MAG: DUF2325 domain-containing protein, partial [Oscillospiraceae bacterium]|nr:DUF2325 domain-containing protein [Oscillospiraceae bacterium]